MAKKAKNICQSAMILAAGLGTRMRPLTNDMPKPLIKVNKRALINHALNRLDAAGVKEAVVNVHYQADKLEAYLKKAKSPKILVSNERKLLLETGGGVAKALPKLGKKPFFVVNTDSLWAEGTVPALTRLKNAWDDETMDAILLLAPTVSSLGYSGNGDFNMDADGNLTRRGERQIAPFVFTGAYILHPRLFKNAPKGKFSMNLLFDKAIKAGRLKGVRHDSLWIEVNTPEAVEIASTVMADL